MGNPAGTTPIRVERTDLTGGDLQFIRSFHEPSNSLFAFGPEDNGAHPPKVGRNYRREQLRSTLHDVVCHGRRKRNGDMWFLLLRRKTELLETCEHLTHLLLLVFRKIQQNVLG